MHRGCILPVGVKSKSENLVSLRILRVHAEGGARFRDRIGAVIQAIEDVRQAAVILREIGHQLSGGGNFVEGVVPPLLLAQHCA